MRTRVRLFGPLARAAGSPELVVETEDHPTPEHLRDAAARQFPALAPQIARCRVAVNHAFASADQAIRTHDEVALVGFVGGG
jgi:molybdopterin converting factor small subunit